MNVQVIVTDPVYDLLHLLVIVPNNFLLQIQFINLIVEPDPFHLITGNLLKLA